MERKVFEGTDLFANLGGTARWIAALALAPFALYFTVVGLVTPLAVVGFMIVEGDRSVAALLLGVGLGHALVGLFLGWFDLRLFRGTKSANQVTILPTWMIWSFLVVFLGPLLIGTACGLAVLAYQAATIGQWRLASLCGAGAVGVAVMTIRGLRSALRLRRGGAPSEAAERQEATRPDDAVRETS